MARPIIKDAPKAPKGKTPAPAAARRGRAPVDEEEDDDEDEEEEEEDDEEEDDGPPRNARRAPARPARDEAPRRSTGRSAYAGARARESRDPFIGFGTYLVRWDEYGIIETDGKDPWARAGFTILESLDAEAKGNGYPDGAKAVLMFPWFGKGKRSSLTKIKSLAVAAAGYEAGSKPDVPNEDDYDAMDPQGLLLAAAEGEENKASIAGVSLLGRTAYVHVKRGNEVKDSDPVDYYRECEWSTDDDQDVLTWPKKSKKAARK